ncbi:unnamed protein product [Cunninghamella echinulata]
MKELRTTSNFHIAGYSYAFFWWGIFTLYCIGHQYKQVRIYWHRRQKLKNRDEPPSTKFNSFDPTLPWERWLRPLDKVVAIPFVTEMIEIKHIIGVSLFVIVNLLFIFFAPFQLSPGYDSYVLESIGLFDRRAAFIGMVNWGFVFLLASRNSMLSAMCGFTFEQMIPFHRWLARIGFLEFIPHFVWRMYKGYIKTYMAKDALFHDLEYGSGTIALIGFLFLFVPSISYIRRNYFEFFYYAHIFGIIIAMIASCIHEVMCFVYFMPVIIFWVMDRCWRSYKSWYIPTVPLEVSTAVPKTANQEGIVRILFNDGHIKSKYHPGQYVFLALSKKGNGWWQHWRFANWHPITISEVFHGLMSTTTSSASSTYFTKDSLTTSSSSSANAYDVEEKINTGNTVTGGGDEKNNNVAGGNDEKKKNIIGNEGTDNIDQIEKEKKVVMQESIPSTPNGNTNTVRLRQDASHVSHRDYSIATLHIKSLGGYTKELLKHSNDQQALYVKVDGPYGPRIEYQDYNVLCCFAAGIGITPALTLIKDCVERRSHGVSTVSTSYVHLTWVVKYADEVKAFTDQIFYWQERANQSLLPLTLDLNIYLTRENSQLGGIAGFNKTIYGQRPVIEDCMNSIPEQKSVVVHACGSDLFMSSVINEAVSKGWHYHHETFEF